MTQTFKPGDRVRAVETNEGNHITEGEVYEVVNSRPSYTKGRTMLTLKGIGDVFSFRFEKIEESTFKVGDLVRWSGTDAATYRVLGRAGDLDHRDARYDWRLENVATGLRVNVYEHELTKIEDRDFPLRNGDELVNVKTGRKGFVVGGMVYDRVPSWVKAVPAKALDEYEHHHPGTYEITYRKQAQPW